MTQMGLVVLIGDARDARARLASLLPDDAVIVSAATADSALGIIARFATRFANNGSRSDRRPLRAGELRVDRKERTTSWRGAELSLTPREFELLATVVAQPGRAVEFHELITSAWGNERKADRDMLRSAVKRLRGKLAAAGANVRIEAVRGYGFRLRVN
jgi:DNA-binding response OmpR family regulator